VGGKFISLTGELAKSVELLRSPITSRNDKEGYRRDPVFAKVAQDLLRSRKGLRHDIVQGDKRGGLHL
jgi:hypothetical protein